MPQTRRRPTWIGRGDGAYDGVRADTADDTTADDHAVERLPLPIRARYVRTCAIWQTIYDHHRAMLRLLAEVAR